MVDAHVLQGGDIIRLCPAAPQFLNLLVLEEHVIVVVLGHLPDKRNLGVLNILLTPLLLEQAHLLDDVAACVCPLQSSGLLEVLGRNPGIVERSLNTTRDTSVIELTGRCETCGHEGHGRVERIDKILKLVGVLVNKVCVVSELIREHLLTIPPLCSGLTEAVGNKVRNGGSVPVHSTLFLLIALSERSAEVHQSRSLKLASLD